MPRRKISRLQFDARHRDTLRALLARYVPASEVWAYGSHISGGGHEGSDLDLVLRNPQDLAAVCEGGPALKDALQDSMLPMLVAVHDWAHLPEDFHHQIGREYIVLQEEAHIDSPESGIEKPSNAT